MRRATGRARFAADLVEYGLGLELAAEIFATRPLAALLGAFADAGQLRNDLVSHGRELRDEGAIANGVLVAQRFLGCDVQEAADAIDRLVSARVDAFEDVARRELPESDDPDRAARLADGLRDWLTGAAVWSRVTGRYDA